MDKKKLVIIILVAVGVVALLVVAGPLRSKKEPSTEPGEQPRGMEVTDALTGWMRSKFDLSRLGTCNGSGLSGHYLPITGECTVTIAPGSARPSRLEFDESKGPILVCFGLTLDKLKECRDSSDGPQRPRGTVKLTIAKSSAFIFFRCLSQNGCAVRVYDD